MMTPCSECRLSISNDDPYHTGCLIFYNLTPFNIEHKKAVLSGQKDCEEFIEGEGVGKGRMYPEENHTKTDIQELKGSSKKNDMRKTGHFSIEYIVIVLLCILEIGVYLWLVSEGIWFEADRTAIGIIDWSTILMMSISTKIIFIISVAATANIVGKGIKKLGKRLDKKQVKLLKQKMMSVLWAFTILLIFLWGKDTFFKKGLVLLDYAKFLTINIFLFLYTWKLNDIRSLFKEENLINNLIINKFFVISSGFLICVLHFFER